MVSYAYELLDITYMYLYRKEKNSKEREREREKTDTHSSNLGNIHAWRIRTQTHKHSLLLGTYHHKKMDKHD